MEQEFEPKGKLRIRAATVEDAQALKTYCFPALSAQEVARALERDVERMQKGEVFRFVVDASGYAVANVCLERHPLRQGAALVRDLAVSPPFRGLGVTNHLMDAMDAVAREHGITSLLVEVASGETKLIESYKRWGFVERPVVILEKVLETQPTLQGLEAEGGEDET